MSRINGFPPIAENDARLLILGSIPGAASLAAGEYYAHPRNLFWRIISTLFDAPAELPYAGRIRLLTAHGIALWDVLAACNRMGSLDTAIDPDSLCINNFNLFFSTHPLIKKVYFNGRTAEILFTRHVQPLLEPDSCPQLLMLLPSTSPAHATLTFEKKLVRWRALAE